MLRITQLGRIFTMLLLVVLFAGLVGVAHAQDGGQFGEALVTSTTDGDPIAECSDPAFDIADPNCATQSLSDESLSDSVESTPADEGFPVIEQEPVDEIGESPFSEPTYNEILEQPVVTDVPTTETEQAVPSVAPETTEPEPVETSTPSDSATETVPTPLAPVKSDTVVVEAGGTVDVTVVAYACTGDPIGDAASSALCAVAPGISFDAYSEGGSLGAFVTDANGSAIVSATLDTTIDLIEDLNTLPDGQKPLGNGTTSVVVIEGQVVELIHVSTAVLGRLQLIAGTCPTSTEAGTVFRIIEPSAASAASEPTCLLAPSTEFTLSGGNLGPEGLLAVTESNGSWRGYLPAGDYQAKAPDGTTSGQFTVLADETTVVIAVEYQLQPGATLTLERFVCEDAVASGVEVFVGSGTDAAATGCDASDGEVLLSMTAAASEASAITVPLGTDGSAELPLQPGSYLVTDLTSVASGGFDAAAGEHVYVTIVQSKTSDDPVDETGGGEGGTGGSGGTGSNTGGTGSNSGGTGGSGDGTGGTGGGVDTPGTNSPLPGGDNTGGVSAPAASTDSGTSSTTVVSGETVRTLPATGAGASPSSPTLAWWLVAFAFAAVAFGTAALKFGNQGPQLVRISRRSRES